MHWNHKNKAWLEILVPEKNILKRAFRNIVLPKNKEYPVTNLVVKLLGWIIWDHHFGHLCPQKKKMGEFVHCNFSVYWFIAIQHAQMNNTNDNIKLLHIFRKTIPIDVDYAK